MKKSYVFPACLMLLACTPVIDVTEATDDTEEARGVQVYTRSGAEISYPLSVYAFDMGTGQLATSATATCDADELSMKLPQGDYQMVAVGGTGTATAQPILDDAMTLPEEGYMQTPLQMGSASVYVTQSTSVSIMLYNQVAALDIVLGGLPAETTEVSVGLSFLYHSISYSGIRAGRDVVKVALKRNGDVWASERFYVLPTNGDRLTLSITITTAEGEQTYGYTHNGPLRANTPYRLEGSLANGFTVDGHIDIAGWQAAEEISFTFGGEGEDTPDDGNDTTDATTTERIPNAGELWNGHLVGAVQETTDSTAVLLLLSAAEWQGIASANHTENADMAATIADNYSEEDIAGWHIPTRDEAKLLRNTLGGDRLEETNRALASYGIPTLQVEEDAEGNPTRYLCDEAKFSFAWESTSISKCGTKRTYALRAVKSIKVIAVDGGKP